MANAGFNGSTITIGSSVSHLRSIRYSSSAAKVDLSGSADAIKTYAAGIPDLEITFDVVGTTSLAIGAAASAVTIAWYDAGGPTGALAGTWIIVGVEVSGDMDGEITSSITLVPATVAA